MILAGTLQHSVIALLIRGATKHVKKISCRLIFAMFSHNIIEFAVKNETLKNAFVHDLFIFYIKIEPFICFPYFLSPVIIFLFNFLLFFSEINWAFKLKNCRVRTKNKHIDKFIMKALTTLQCPLIYK